MIFLSYSLKNIRATSWPFQLPSSFIPSHFGGRPRLIPLFTVGRFSVVAGEKGRQNAHEETQFQVRFPAFLALRTFSALSTTRGVAVVCSGAQDSEPTRCLLMVSHVGTSCCLAENIVFKCISLPAGGVSALVFCSMWIQQVHQGLYASKMVCRYNCGCLATK